MGGWRGCCPVAEVKQTSVTSALTFGYICCYSHPGLRWAKKERKNRAEQMLAEGFLRVLLYREGRQLASASKRSESHAKDACNCNLSTTDSPEAGRELCKMK